MVVEVREFEQGSREYMKSFGEGRYPSTGAILQHFAWSHLPASLQPISRNCADLAIEQVAIIPDGPELTVGLRKLLEAKDCFVRAALDD